MADIFFTQEVPKKQMRSMGKIPATKRAFGKYSVIPFDRFETFLERAKLMMDLPVHRSVSTRPIHFQPSQTHSFCVGLLMLPSRSFF